MRIQELYAQTKTYTEMCDSQANSHTRTVLSRLAEAIFVPVGDHCTAFTRSGNYRVDYTHRGHPGHISRDQANRLWRHSNNSTSPRPTVSRYAVRGNHLPSGARSFGIVSQDSTASYQASFQAAGQSLPGSVTGITSDVSGQFLLTQDEHIQSLQIVVDLRTLDSGSPDCGGSSLKGRCLFLF